MESALSGQKTTYLAPGFREAWQMVLGQIRPEMSRTDFETWVLPLRPIEYQRGVFTVGAHNPFGREWVENRLTSRLARLLSGLLNEEITFKVIEVNGFAEESGPENLSLQTETASPADRPALTPANAPVDIPAESRSRKVMLQRAYGSERARIIQPERGMFLTLYFFANWLPLLGHSAAAVILAARSLCYWNPLTGELRNIVETDMSDLARRASVSVRTVKDVLNMELVRRYFLRYRVRRMMTPNGVRTAGISMQVRMDDPLTPQDQESNHLEENEIWFADEFGDEPY